MTLTLEDNGHMRFRQHTYVTTPDKCRPCYAGASEHDAHACALHAHARGQHTYAR